MTDDSQNPFVATGSENSENPFARSELSDGLNEFDGKSTSRLWIPWTAACTIMTFVVIGLVAPNLVGIKSVLLLYGIIGFVSVLPNRDVGTRRVLGIGGVVALTSFVGLNVLYLVSGVSETLGVGNMVVASTIAALAAFFVATLASWLTVKLLP